MKDHEKAGQRLLEAKALMEKMNQVPAGAYSTKDRAVQILLEVYVAGEEWGIRALVRGNLEGAKENGYFDEGEHLHGATAGSIADDMISYAENVEYIPRELLIPPIQEWLDEQETAG